MDERTVDEVIWHLERVRVRYRGRTGRRLMEGADELACWMCRLRRAIRVEGERLRWN